MSPVLRLLATGLTLVAIAICPPGASAAENPRPARGELLRQITIAELGYESGVSFSGLVGEAEFFFPMPDPGLARSPVLTLRIEHGADDGADRFLRVLSGERILTAVNLARLPSPGTLDIGIDPSLGRDGVLPLRLVYDGAMADRVCFDERSAGDFANLLPATTLSYGLDQRRLASPELIAGFQPRQTVMAIPRNGVDPVDLSAALRAASVFGADRGLLTFADDTGTLRRARGPGPHVWDRGYVHLAESRALLTHEAELAVGLGQTWPHLRIAGADPQQALEALTSPWRSVANGLKLATDGAGRTAVPPDRVTFKALDFDLRPRSAIGTARFEFRFDIADLPPGRTPSSVSVGLVSAPGAAGVGATAVVYLNDTVLGSLSLPDGAPHWLDAPVPEGVVGRDNLLVVEFVRPPQGGECRVTKQAFPSQVLPGSAMTLTSMSPEAADFYELRSRMQSGIDLLVQAEAARATDLLAQIAPAVASLVPPRADITPVTLLDPQAEERGFLLVSPHPPQGSLPRLLLDRGEAEVRGADGGLLFRGADLDDLTVVQIVSVGQRQGIWIRPGSGAPPAPSTRRPLRIDRGDIAVLDADGLALALSSQRRDLIDVRYPGQRNLADTVSRYWPWIIGGLWLLVTLVILNVLNRAYRARRDTDGTA